MVVDMNPNKYVLTDSDKFDIPFPGTRDKSSSDSTRMICLNGILLILLLSTADKKRPPPKNLPSDLREAQGGMYLLSGSHLADWLSSPYLNKPSL